MALQLVLQAEPSACLSASHPDTAKEKEKKIEREKSLRNALKQTTN
jgi:hypothetical protein